MAITQTYVDYGTGNDYNGASFTDGAYTSATKILAKNGAFTKTKVNHWLYLSSNAGGSIVAGYYKVATATDANSVILATDAGSGVDATDVKCTQATGTTLLPYRSIQGALDIITRNATDGDQINIKAGTAQVVQAALTLTTYGTPAYNGALVLRGYTTAANDGGIGEIDCNGATMWATTTYDFILLVDLKIHNFGDNHGIQLREAITLWNCEVTCGASSPSGKRLISIGGAEATVARCYVHDAGAGAAIGIYTASTGFVGLNYVVLGSSAAASSYGIYKASSSGFNAIINNIISCSGTAQRGIYAAYHFWIIGNTLYNSTAGTGNAIYNDATYPDSIIINNVIEGWSGTGGKAIRVDGNISVVGYNAFFNNTATNSIGDQLYLDLTSHDVTLGASAFTSAAGANFAVSTALKALGFPASFLGAATNTYIDIGAAQRQEPAGGAVSISPTLGSVGAA